MVLLFWLSILFIGYAYVGYPLILALLARLWPKRAVAELAERPSVTLLVAAYNEAAVIADKLENSLALDYPADKLQIIVAADGSDDETAQMARHYEDRGVLVNYRPERMGKMAAINRAMPLATGEIVLFSDANNMYAPDTVREMVRPFADATVAAVSGAKRILKGDGALGASEGLYWRYESLIKKYETRIGCCTAVAGEILALRRDRFVSPPDDIINDDFYMAMQLVKQGYRVVYAPAAHSFERVSLSAQDEVARRARIVAGRYQAMFRAAELLPWQRPLVAWQIISHKYVRPLVPLAMIMALISNIWLVGRLLGNMPKPSPWASWPLVMLALQGLFYGAAAVGSVWESKGMIGKLLYVPNFLVQSNMAALIGLYRFLTRQQTTRWQRAQRRPHLSK